MNELKELFSKLNSLDFKTRFPKDSFYGTIAYWDYFPSYDDINMANDPKYYWSHQTDSIECPQKYTSLLKADDDEIQREVPCDWRHLYDIYPIGAESESDDGYGTEGAMPVYHMDDETHTIGHEKGYHSEREGSPYF